jgi:hypothetical protein
MFPGTGGQPNLPCGLLGRDLVELGRETKCD